MTGKDFRALFKGLNDEQKAIKAQKIKEQYMCGEIALHEYQVSKICKLANTGRGAIAFGNGYKTK